MTLLWDVRNSAFGSRIVIVAVDANEALDLAKRITGYSLNWQAGPFLLGAPDDQDDAIEAVELWWGAYCDYAEGNESISDAEYDSVMDLVHRTEDVIYEV